MLSAAFIGYLDLLQAFYCAPCTVGSSDQIPWITVNTATTPHKTTLGICEDYAKQIYSPDVDPKDVQAMLKVDLNAPATEFDRCGFITLDTKGELT